jgi:hypothetical protein
MLDTTDNTEAVAQDWREQAHATDARWSDRATGFILFVTSFVACVLLVVEAIFGLLWALSAGFREYASLLMH